MVVFTCQKCNSTLKKNAVEKHFSCRPFFLTCIDCLKDFKGKEYDAHTSCITEAEKYGGGKTIVKQQGVKQGKWAENAQEILTEISNNPRYSKVCAQLKQSSNIPRQRKKFHNFVRSSCPRLYNSNIIDEIFDHLEKVKNSDQNSNTNSSLENTSESNKSNENNVQKMKKRKKSEEKSSDLENSVNLDESSSTNEDNNKKRPLIETECHISEKEQNGTAMKKRKKNKKFSSDSQSFSNDSHNQQNKENEEKANESNGNELNKSLNEENADEKLGEAVKLSKRQLKKLKKQKKYMAEVAEIETVQPAEESVTLEEEDKVEKKKRKKKMKDEPVVFETDPSAEHSPKRKYGKEDNIEDISSKKIKLNETLKEEDIPIENGKKFKWSQIIKQILENSSNNEMQLKKLRKKVMSEYRAQKGDDTPYEKLLSTFNKKVNSTEGIKVLKDKAQLVLA